MLLELHAEKWILHMKHRIRSVVLFSLYFPERETPEDHGAALPW